MHMRKYWDPVDAIRVARRWWFVSLLYTLRNNLFSGHGLIADCPLVICSSVISLSPILISL
jgi:hypothetical protein